MVDVTASFHPFLSILLDPESEKPLPGTSSLRVIEFGVGNFPLMKHAGVDALLLRRETTAFIDLLWNEFKHRDPNKRIMRVVMIGSPGIGKSCSLTLMLRHALREGRNVIYDYRAMNKRYFFIPSQQTGSGQPGEQSYSRVDDHFL